MTSRRSRSTDPLLAASAGREQDPEGVLSQRGRGAASGKWMMTNGGRHRC